MPLPVSTPLHVGVDLVTFFPRIRGAMSWAGAGLRRPSSSHEHQRLVEMGLYAQSPPRK